MIKSKKLTLHIPTIVERLGKKRKSSFSTKMRNIVYVIIDGVFYYRKDYMINNGNSMPEFYRIVKKNMSNISLLETEEVILHMKNGVLHNFHGPAIIRELSNTFYIKGKHCFEKDFLENEERKQFLIREKRKKILNELIDE